MDRAYPKISRHASECDGSESTREKEKQGRPEINLLDNLKRKVGLKTYTEDRRKRRTIMAASNQSKD